MHTAIKYFKVYFSGSCTYLESEIALIFPEKDPGSQQYRNYGRDMSNKRGNKIHVPEAALGGHQHKKVRKENGVDISNNSRYYSPDEWSKLSSAPKSKLLSNPKRISAKEERAGDKKISTNVRSSSVAATAKVER